MKVALLIITHNQIGQELISTASSILGNSIPPIHSISIPGDLNPGDIGAYADQVRDAIGDLGSGHKVLILTDIYGATPNNLARYFADDLNAVVLSGINLPMLIRVINYAEQDFDQLVITAIEGGKKGVMLG